MMRCGKYAHHGQPSGVVSRCLAERDVVDGTFSRESEDAARRVRSIRKKRNLTTATRASRAVGGPSRFRAGGGTRA